jgi:G:T-mismatch repair DNA endonuclease (very short patch repair protein)
MRKSRHDCSDEIQSRRNETTNRAFWAAKLSRNKARDRKVRRTLRADGWCVLRVWKCAPPPLPRHGAATIGRRMRFARCTGCR